MAISKPQSSTPLPHPPLAMMLEPRFMFDAAGIATGAELVEQTGDSTADTGTADAQADSSELATALSGGEIAFVDTSVEGYETLVAGLDPDIEVILLNGTGDAIAQMAGALEGRSDLDAIHIISHGSESSVVLGDTTLSGDNLEAYREQLGIIGSALSEGGDILLYGCEIASGTGQDFIDNLADMTGADIAASDDLTGHADLGGDWELEVASGHIEADVPFSEAALKDFTHLLAPFTGTIDFEDVNDYGAYNGAASINAKFNVGSYILVVDGQDYSTQAYDGVNSTSLATTAGFKETKLTFYIDGGGTFDVTSLKILNLNYNGNVFTISSDLGDTYDTSALNNGEWTTATLSGFTGITKLYITGSLAFGMKAAYIDDMVVANFGTPSNAAPSIANLDGDTLLYTEGDSATLIDQGTSATVTDGDSTDFDGGNLTVTITAGEDPAEDVLSLSTTGSVSLDGTTSGSNVRVSGTVIGTLGNDIAAGNDLVVNFNSSATASTAQTLTEAITYENTDLSAPTTGGRTVRVTVNDGDGGTSSNSDVAVIVSSSDVLSYVPASDAAYYGGTGGTAVIAQSFTATKTGTFDTLTLAAYMPIGETVTLNVYDGSGTGGTLLGTQSVSAFNTAGTMDGNRYILTDIAITPTINLTNGNTYTFEFTPINKIDLAYTSNSGYTDGIMYIDGIASQPTYDVVFAITQGDPPNNVPTIDIDGTPTYTEGGSALTVDSSVTIADADGVDADLDDGYLSVAITSGSTANDRLTLDTTGTVGLSGTTVSISGTNVGTLVDTSGTNDDGTVNGSDILRINFNANITGAYAQTLAQAITFSNVSDDPSTSNRTVTYTINDGTDSGTDTATVSLTAVNDEPTLTATGSNPTFTEGGAAASLFSGASIDTVESGQNISQLIFTVTNVNDGADETISIDGTSVALTNGNSGSTGSGFGYSVSIVSTTATVTLTKTDTAANYQTLIDNLTYSNASENPNTTNRVVTITSVKDDGGTANGGDDTNATLSITSTVTVAGVNDAPTISNLNGDSVSFSIGGSAVVLNSGTAAGLTDVDSADFSGGNVTVSITANGQAGEDILSVGDIGAISTSGTNINHSDGFTIGTVSGGSGGADLVISLNANATPARVADLLNALQYVDSDSGTVNTAARTITITVNDGDGGTSTNQDVTVTLVRAPIIDLDGDDSTGAGSGGYSGSFTEDGGAVALADSDSSISDDGTFKSLTVTLTNRPDGVAESLSSTYGSGSQTVNSEAVTISAYNSSTGVLTITVDDGSASAVTMKMIMDSIRYDNSSDAPDTMDRTITFSATDNDDNAGSAVNSVISVSATNDNPTISSLPSDITVTEDTVSNVDLSAATLADADSTGSGFTLTITAGTGTLTASTGGGVTVSNSGTSALTLTGTAANIDTFLNTTSNIQYTGVANAEGNDADTLTLTANDQDGSGDLNLGTVNVDITNIDDEPTLTATGSSPSFIEGGSAVGLFASTAIGTVESGQNIASMALTVTNIADGTNEFLMIDGTSVALTNGNSGVTASNSFGYAVSVAGSTATVTLTKTDTTANYQTLVNGLQYANSQSNVNSSNRVVTITELVDSGSSSGSNDNTAALSVSSTVSMTNVNDEPTLTATGSDPTFTEGSSAASLFSSTAISTVESGQNISQLIFTVTNINDGASETISIDGTSVALTNGNSGTSSSNSFGYAVAISGTTATVTISKTDTAVNYQTLVNNLAYANASDTPNTSNRVVTITSVKDSGGTANSGDDTNTTLSVSSTITITAVNDEPTLTATGADPDFILNGSAVTLFSSASVSTVESGQNITQMVFTVTHISGTGTTESVTVDGTDVALSDGNSGTTSSHSFGYSVSLSGGTATVTISKTDTVANYQALVNGLAYSTSLSSTDGNDRVATITSLTDSGSNTGANDNINTTLSVSSTVTLSERAEEDQGGQNDLIRSRRHIREEMSGHAIQEPGRPLGNHSVPGDPADDNTTARVLAMGGNLTNPTLLADPSMGINLMSMVRSALFDKGTWMNRFYGAKAHFGGDSALDNRQDRDRCMEFSSLSCFGPGNDPGQHERGLEEPADEGQPGRHPGQPDQNESRGKGDASNSPEPQQAGEPLTPPDMQQKRVQSIQGKPAFTRQLAEAALQQEDARWGALARALTLHNDRAA